MFEIVKLKYTVIIYLPVLYVIINTSYQRVLSVCQALYVYTYKQRAEHMYR